MTSRRFVFGLLSARCSGDARKVWNELIAKHNVDGFFDFYPTRSKEDLERRLSEMFHLGRAAYVLSPSLSEVVTPLLDRLDVSAAERGTVDTVLNEGGMLCGYAAEHLPRTEQLALWTTKTISSLSD